MRRVLQGSCFPAGSTRSNEADLEFANAVHAAFKHIATNSLGETLMATPAISDGVMFVRGASTLFAIGRRPGAP